SADKLLAAVRAAVEEIKAKDVVEIDVRGKTSVADHLVIASGTSTRHVKSIADEVVKFAKKLGAQPLGVEGEREAEWVLVDLGDVIVHVMLPRVREFYALERLWSVGDQQPRSAADVDDAGWSSARACGRHRTKQGPRLGAAFAFLRRWASRSCVQKACPRVRGAPMRLLPGATAAPQPPRCRGCAGLIAAAPDACRPREGGVTQSGVPARRGLRCPGQPLVPAA